MKPILYALLIALLLATPVAATVQYPEEYYTLGNQSWKLSEDNQRSFSDWRIYIATYYELRRQTILMEKQNELLQEQNELLKQLVPVKQDRIEIDPSAFNGTWYYCNALNTSQCWKNASEIPRYLP